MKKFVAVCVTLGLIIAITACGSKKNTATGEKMPAFELPDLSGAVVASSSFEGKVLLIDFWATWCPPCRDEIPGFIELQNTYKDQGLEIIGISVDQNKADLVAFVPANNMNYTVLHDTTNVTPTAFGGIQGIPTTFLVNKKGNIVQKWVGYHPKEVFETEIKKLLAE